MVAMAIRDLGLKPSELYDMELCEYVLYAEGFVIRRDREAANFRRLYTLIHDVNVSPENQIGGSLEKINAHWPLGIDDIEPPKALTEDEMIEKFRLLQI